jgi:hypothetical protein
MPITEINKTPNNKKAQFLLPKQTLEGKNAQDIGKKQDHKTFNADKHNAP